MTAPLWNPPPPAYAFKLRPQAVTGTGSAASVPMMQALAVQDSRLLALASSLAVQLEVQLHGKLNHSTAIATGSVTAQSP